jgi:hypothetical protein
MKQRQTSRSDQVTNTWLTRKQAAAKIGVSDDTIDRRAIPWQEEHTPFKLRYKILILGSEKPEGRRYFEPDVEALLFNPKRLPSISGGETADL